MVQFNELRITPDNRELIIDVSVKDLDIYTNVYLDYIIRTSVCQYKIRKFVRKVCSIYVAIRTEVWYNIEKQQDIPPS